MADSRYCRMCHGPCDNCDPCLGNPHRFKPTPDRIKTALEKKGAFTSSTFRTISSDPPKISVSDRADGGSEVAVKLTSMLFIPAYRDPRSPERRELETAAREEIIRSFDLPRGRVGDGDIEIDIREGSVQILAVLCASLVIIAAAVIAGLCFTATDSTYSAKAKDIKTVGSSASGAVIGATAGTVGGPIGMAIGGAIGYIGGKLFGDAFF